MFTAHHPEHVLTTMQNFYTPYGQMTTATSVFRYSAARAVKYRSSRSQFISKSPDMNRIRWRSRISDTVPIEQQKKRGGKFDPGDFKTWLIGLTSDFLGFSHEQSVEFPQNGAQKNKSAFKVWQYCRQKCLDQRSPRRMGRADRKATSDNHSIHRS